MIDYKDELEATHKPRTLKEYGAGLYFGLIDIKSELECYDIDKNFNTDIEAIEYLINYAEEAQDYEQI